MNRLCPALTYYNISPGIKAFSTTRHGGCSVGQYASFNINNYCGDNPEHVATNRHLLATELNIEPSHIIMPHQTHGIETCVIDNEYMSLSEEEKRIMLEGVDAIMTNQHELCIGVSTADCIPILLYDEQHNAICAIHAGWRGTLARIVNKAVINMVTAYHTTPQQLKALIGPGISRHNFEVGDEVYEAFEKEAFDMTAIAKQYTKRGDCTISTTKPCEKKWHIDLPLCNRLTLEHLGVPTNNIIDSGICTYEHVDEYFSARRLGIESGRIFTGIMLT